MKLGVANLQRLSDHARRAFTLREDAGVPFAPKWHLCLHLVCRADVAGNPHFCSTFVDEDYNGRLAKLAAVCHRATWCRRVLAGFRQVYSRPAKRRLEL